MPTMAVTTVSASFKLAASKTPLIPPSTRIVGVRQPYQIGRLFIRRSHRLGAETAGPAAPLVHAAVGGDGGHR